MMLKIASFLVSFLISFDAGIISPRCYVFLTSSWGFVPCWGACLRTSSKVMCKMISRMMSTPADCLFLLIWLALIRVDAENVLIFR